MIADEDEARAWLESRSDVTAVTFARLDRFAAMLREENSRQNLISPGTMDAIWLRHLADSAQLIDHVPRETGTWLDLGSGAGLPGLIVAMLRDSPMIVIESRAKRVEWLRHAASELALGHVQVIGRTLSQVESLKAGVISARAFAPLDRLLDLSARFSTERTRWVLPKGAMARDELSALRGWRHVFHVEPSLTHQGAGIIVGHLLGRSDERR